MADEPIAPAAAPAASPAPAPAAAAPAPAAAPAAPATPAAPAPAPAAAPTVGDGAPAPKEGGDTPSALESGTEPPKPALAGDEPTLLETVGREEPKKDDKKPENPEIQSKPAENPNKFDFKPFQAPEGVNLDETRIGTLNDVLNKGLPPQEQRDALVNLHIEEMQSYDQQLRQHQQDVFKETRAGWRKELMADPELGGSGFETTKLHGAEMRDMFVSRHKPGTENYNKEMAQFNDMLRYTGVGDHPAFWRLLNNVARRFKEPAAPRTEFQPPADLGKRPGEKGRRSSLYDHPTSSRMNGS